MNNWLGSIFLALKNIHTKGLLGQLHLGLEGVTEVDIDPKGKFVFFKITLSNNKDNYAYYAYLLIANIPELLSVQELPYFLDDKLKIFPRLISN